MTTTRSLAMRCAMVLVLAACGHRQDLHDGRTLAQWYAVLHSRDAGERERAAAIIAQYAPEHPETRRALLDALQNESNADVHVTLAGAVGALGASGTDAVPGLMRLLHDEHEPVKSTALRSLGRIAGAAPAVRPRVVPVLVERLADGDHDVRASAADAIALAARDAASAAVAAPALAWVAEHDMTYVRWRAVAAVANVPVADSIAVAVFGRALADEFQELQVAACDGVRARGRKMVALEGAVRRVARSGDPEVQAAAAAALAALGEGRGTAGMSGWKAR